MNQLSPTRILATAALLVVVMTACGDGDEGVGTSTTAPEQATTSSSIEVTTTTAAPGADAGDGPELAGTAWQVAHLASELFPDITNVWPDTEITIQFSEDGTVSGNAGCNDYTGDYQLGGPYVTDPEGDAQEGQSLTITDLQWTEMACDSDNLMEQETEYLEDLQRVEHWRIGQGFESEESLLLLSLEEGLQVEGIPAD